MTDEEFEVQRLRVAKASGLQSTIGKLKFFDKNKWFRLTSYQKENNPQKAVCIDFQLNSQTIQIEISEEQAQNFLKSVIESLVKQELEARVKELEKL